jgi:large-conductance mechanosensitive channel
MGAAVLRYGLFINAIVNFMIVAFAIFLVLRSITPLPAHAAGPGRAASAHSASR